MRGSIVFSDRMWHLIEALEGLTGPVPADSFCLSVESSVRDLAEGIEFLANFDREYVVEKREGEFWIVPPQQRPRIELSMSLCQWLALQAHFPLMEGYREKAFHQTVSEFLGEVEKSLPRLDLFPVLDSQRKTEIWKRSLPPAESKIFFDVEKAIQLAKPILIKTVDGKLRTFFCHRPVYLEGKVCLVGEDVSDRCLAQIPVQEIENVELCDKTYNPVYSILEINDFIQALRQVSGTEERLVLRILDQEGLDLSPAYQFLGNPYMTSNSQGELIWAANVEVSKELFIWLDQMGNKVEIIEPEKIRNQLQGDKWRKAS